MVPKDTELASLILIALVNTTTALDGALIENDKKLHTYGPPHSIMGQVNLAHIQFFSCKLRMIKASIL